MKIRNYTSSVPVERSVTDIERLLVEAGATHIVRFYDEGKRLKGFTFSFAVDGKTLTFKLPVNPDSVHKLLEQGVKRLTPTVRENLRAQAERTAWKLLLEWVHIQITLIQMKQAEAVQVFLPYAYDTKKGKTLYEHFAGSGFKALTAGGE